jgi:hypothetical protein
MPPRARPGHGALLATWVPFFGALAACGGDGAASDAGPDATPACIASDTPPTQPSVIPPAVSFGTVVVDGLAIGGSPFIDPDLGDTAGGAEVELWTTAGGTLGVRVWHASYPGAFTQAVLADGAFDAPFTQLDAWTDYAARLRYRDSHDGCGVWSDWSEPVAFRTDDGSATLFDPSMTHDLYLELPQSSIDAMNAEAIPPDCIPWERHYQPGNVIIDGVRFDGVGVKIKGGCGSARTLDGKPGLKVNLGWDDPAVPGCPPSRRYLGEKGFTLNNQVQDHSATHERLGYILYQAMGVPTPRAAPVRVFVNGQLMGLYLDVETVDRRFLAHRFDDNAGMLYEGTYYCDLVAANLPAGDEDNMCLTREFTPDACTTADPAGDPLTYDPLRDLVARLDAMPDGAFYPEIESFFDFDTFLSMWAVEAVMAHWDDYAYQINNNYRVYHDPSTGRWTMIPTGIDQTFGGDLDPWGALGRLATRCLGEPDCEAAFAARVHTVLNVYAGLDLPGRAETIYQQIRPYVEADPRKEYDMAEFDAQHAALLQWIADRPAIVQMYLAMHGY